MLRLSVQKDEYIMVGKDVKITFLGGVKNQAHIMIDAPKEVNIARGRAIEKRAATGKICNDTVTIQTPFAKPLLCSYIFAHVVTSPYKLCQICLQATIFVSICMALNSYKGNNRRLAQWE